MLRFKVKVQVALQVKVNPKNYSDWNMDLISSNLNSHLTKVVKFGVVIVLKAHFALHTYASSQSWVTIFHFKDPYMI